MKIKLDENLPDRLIPALTDLGHDVDTVILERLAGHDDHAVWQASQRADRFRFFEGSVVELRDTPGRVLRSGVTRRDAGCRSARFTSAR